MESKVCTKCNEDKLLSEYVKDVRHTGGYKCICKQCFNAYKKEYVKRNKEKILTANKDYRAENKDKIATYAKKRYVKSKVKISAYSKQYKITNKERDRVKNNKTKALYKQKRIATDPLYKLRINTSNLISISLKRKGYTKKSKSFQILGCSAVEFKEHLESKFETWMNWDNYGKYNGELNHGWDIDHIIPVSSATSEADLLLLNHYTNLQPLCSYVNRYVKKHL